MQKRQILVDSVVHDSQSLTKISRKLNIKLSTAKLILRKYKQTGVILDKKMRNAKKVNVKLEESNSEGLSSCGKDNALSQLQKNIELLPHSQKQIKEDYLITEPIYYDWTMLNPADMTFLYWAYPFY